MWKNKFDKVFLINLENRKDRLEASIAELSKYSIPYEVFPAVKNEDGAYGLFLTMYSLFKHADNLDLKNILVFEDDVQFCVEDFNRKFDIVMKESEQIEWDLIYLGANINHPLKKVPDCESLLSCHYMLSTHAIAYSHTGWHRCFTQINNILNSHGDYEPIDQLYARTLQQLGRKCFVTNPFLAVQRHDYSDILNSEVNYTYDWKKKFNKALSEMNHGVV